MDAGQLLGNRYRLDQRIEGGGMGDVWRGRDTRLDRTVAIKVLHSGLASDETFRQRFHGEARAVAALQAPGVVNLFDYGEDDSSDTGIASYLIMEFVPGKSLRTVLNERVQLSNTDTLDVVAQAADALDAAHRVGIVHRDVKPGNILIDQNSGQIKLVDFGIARTRGQSHLTETGAVMGSVSYVSPEALYGRELTGASDVYSLGIVAYECLAGVKPFPGDVPATIIAEQLHKTPPALPDSVPPELSNAVMKALAKDPYDRWDSAAAFAAACRQLRETGPIDTSSVSDDATVRVAADAIPTTVLPKEPEPATVRLAAHSTTPPDGIEGADTAESDTAENVTSPPAAPSRGARVLVVAATVLTLVAVGGVAAAYTWNDSDDARSQNTGSSESIADDDDTSEDSTSPSASDSISEEETTSSSESESSSSSSSESSSSSSEEPDTAAIPNLIGMSEDAAHSALSAEGFTNTSSYPVGDGSFACEVVEQDPAAGTEEELDAAVSFGVEYVADEQECNGGGSPTASDPSQSAAA